MFFLVRIIVFLIVVLFQIGNPLILYGLHSSATGDQEADDLEAFLEDPVANFDRIKAIANLCDRIISGYELKRGPRQGFLDLLFTRHFQEVDERKIEIVIYLYRHLSGCYGEIGDKTRMIFCLRPEMFVRVLENEPEWRSMIDGLSLKWESFSPGLSRLGDLKFEREVKEYALFLHTEREQKIKIVEAFINDPVANFERIRTWNDICYWISKYEDLLYKDKEPGELLMDIFLKAQFQEIDEKKIEILVYMVPRCSGAYGELLSDETAKVFWLHPQMFVKVLERTAEWKDVIDDISMLGWGYFWKGLLKLGDTKFEKELKNYVAEKIRKNGACYGLWSGRPGRVKLSSQLWGHHVALFRRLTIPEEIFSP